MRMVRGIVVEEPGQLAFCLATSGFQHSWYTRATEDSVRKRLIASGAWGQPFRGPENRQHVGA